MKGSPPAEENGMLLDGEWRRVPLASVPSGCGVPSGRFIGALAREYGYLAYESAMALAWWFLAACEGIAVETRIVEYEFKCSYSAERVADGDPIGELHSLLRKLPAAEPVTEK